MMALIWVAHEWIILLQKKLLYPKFYNRVVLIDEFKWPCPYVSTAVCELVLLT